MIRERSRMTKKAGCTAVDLLESACGARLTAHWAVEYPCVALAAETACAAILGEAMRATVQASVCAVGGSRIGILAFGTRHTCG